MDFTVPVVASVVVAAAVAIGMHRLQCGETIKVNQKKKIYSVQSWKRARFHLNNRNAIMRVIFDCIFSFTQRHRRGLVRHAVYRVSRIYAIRCKEIWRAAHKNRWNRTKRRNKWTKRKKKKKTRIQIKYKLMSRQTFVSDMPTAIWERNTATDHTHSRRLKFTHFSFIFIWLRALTCHSPSLERNTHIRAHRAPSDALHSTDSRGHKVM